jgi:hypothetical protein
LAILWRFATTQELSAVRIEAGILEVDSGRASHARLVSHILAPSRERPPRGYTALDKARLIDELVTLLARHTAHQLRDADVLGALDVDAAAYGLAEAVRAPHSTLRDAVHAAMAVVRLTEAAYRPPDFERDLQTRARPDYKKRSLHSIPDDILRYLPPPFGSDAESASRPNSGQIRDKAAEVRRQLEGRDTSRISFIVGKAHAGKTGVLVEVLRGLAKDSESDSGSMSLVLRARSTGGDRPLPVVVFDTQTLTNRSLTIKVFNYLSFLCDPRHATLRDVEMVSAAADSRDTEGIDGLLESIKKLHAAQPALFVFLDWEVFNADSTRSLLRRVGRARLLGALHDSNRDSRFVITALGEVRSQTERPLLHLPKMTRISLEDPDFGEIRRYLPGLRYPAGIAAPLTQLQVAMGTSKVPGDILLAMAIALDLHADRPPETNEALTAIADYCRNATSSPEKADSRPLFRLILRSLEGMRLLRAVMVIASSEDGMRIDSLRQVLAAWNDQEPFVEGFDWNAIDSGLRALTKVGASFFLVLRRSIAFDPDEFDVAEGASKDDLVWEISVKLVEHIQRAVESWPAPASGFEPDQLRCMREARRQVASFARRRAQTKRMRSISWARPPEIYHLQRDIQSYTALLASIDPTEMGAGRPTGEDRTLLRMADGAVFTVGRSFDPRLALRYALKCILRKEIDDDHELTMVYDYDPIRLRLYLLMFFPLGLLHSWYVENLSLRQGSDVIALPEAIPIHLLQSFRAREIMMLLTTVAITAFHCQNAEVVTWARLRAEELLALPDNQVSTHDKEDLFLLGTRVWCSYIDAAIQHGAPTDEPAGADPGLLRTLHYVRGLLDSHFADFKNGPPAAKGGIVTERERRRLIAWMRLRAREAELCALAASAQPGDSGMSLDYAVSLYEGIERLEQKVATADGNEDPVVFSGRTARRYMRLLFRIGQGESRPVGTASRRRDATIRGLIEINKARLRRFGGADQVAVYLDEARYRVFAAPADLEFSIKLVRLALNLCDQGSASHGMRLEALLLLSDLLVVQVGRMFDDGAAREGIADNIRDVQGHLDLVVRVAGALNFQPSVARGKLLQARCELYNCRLSESGIEKIIASRSLLKQAQDILERCGDHSHDPEIAVLIQDQQAATSTVGLTSVARVSTLRSP